MGFFDKRTATLIFRAVALSVLSAVFFGTGIAIAPEQADATVKKNSVKISKIKSITAKYGGKAKISPSVKTSGKVKVSSKLLTVKQGTKTVAKNKKTTHLKAGTYKVTTTVKYKVGTAKKSNIKFWTAGDSHYLTDALEVNCVISSWIEDEEWDEYEWQSVCTDAEGNKYLTSGDDWSEEEHWATSTDPTKYGVGGTWSGTLESEQIVYKATQKSKSVSKTVYGKTKTKKLTQTLVIKQGKKPTSITPSGWDCPAAYPIKGNQSGIYHVRGGAYYSRTSPEECFSSESAARSAGYRKSKR